MKRAIRMMSRSLEIDGTQQNLMYNLAYLQKKVYKKCDLAVETLHRLLLINPNHATALGLLANIHASSQSGALQDLARARILYERALKISPNDSTNRNNYEIFLTANVGDE